MATHLAAVFPGPSEPFKVERRTTPTPGPSELLIAVKSVALNPADHIMQDTGFFIGEYPNVLGFDLAGTILTSGPLVPSHFQPSQTKPAIRVAAYAAHAFHACNPHYGAFQERVLVPWQHVILLLSSPQMTWNEAATLPVSAQVSLNAWDILGIPRPPTCLPSPTSTSTSTSNSFFTILPSLPQGGKKEKKEALLIWGASSSVGTMGVQTARLLCHSPHTPFATVYAVAGSANHPYVSSLGADRVFDHRDPKVASQIVNAAQLDGVIIRHCFLAVGDLGNCQAILAAFDGIGKIASAPPIPASTQTIPGVEVLFIQPSSNEGERLGQFASWMSWISDAVKNGGITPSPEAVVVGRGRGLEGVQEGLGMLRRKEVSCGKVVIEMDAGTQN